MKDGAHHDQVECVVSRRRVIRQQCFRGVRVEPGQCSALHPLRSVQRQNEQALNGESHGADDQEAEFARGERRAEAGPGGHHFLRLFREYFVIMDPLLHGGTTHQST